MTAMAENPVHASANKPGYRQLWPWLLALVPIATVIASAVTLWLAFRSEDGLVAEDYYKQGLTINRRIEREQAAARLGLSAQLQYNAAEGSVTVVLPAGTPRPPTLSLRVAHPTRSGHDQTIILQPTGPDTYAGPLQLSAAPHWYVFLENEDSTWRLTGELREGADAVRLGAGE